MLGTVGACPIETMPLEIIELELTNFDSTSAMCLQNLCVFGSE